jgi:1-acyl-sn-glycerol-3-phosphate acyltransferase
MNNTLSLSNPSERSKSQNFAFWLVTYSLKRLVRILCRIDDSQLYKVPRSGPLILVCNHINFLEVPTTFTHLQPRPLTGYVKSEAFKQPLIGSLMKLWDGIPLHRGEGDTRALRAGVEAVKSGKILAIAPEGTRSGHGRLQKAHPGVVTLALLSGSPLQPLVYFGGEKLYENLKRFRRTDFYLRVGQPFRLDTQGKKATQEVRLEIIDQIMYQLAVLLPEEYRGVYSDLSKTRTSYLQFIDLEDLKKQAI